MNLGKIHHIAIITSDTVDDVEKAAKELNELGIKTEPIRLDDYTGKKMTFFRDPDGLPLELHE